MWRIPPLITPAIITRRAESTLEGLDERFDLAELDAEEVRLEDLLVALVELVSAQA